MFASVKSNTALDEGERSFSIAAAASPIFSSCISFKTSSICFFSGSASFGSMSVSAA